MAIGQYSRRSVDTAGDRPSIAVSVFFFAAPSYVTLGNLDHLPSSAMTLLCGRAIARNHCNFKKVFVRCYEKRVSASPAALRAYGNYSTPFFLFLKQKKAVRIAEREPLKKKKTGMRLFFFFLSFCLDFFLGVG
jgi:hypothetical protein